MNANQLRELRALRVLREQRVTRELAAQQQLCREAESERDAARQRLFEHRQALAGEAEALYGKFSEGLSVKAWQNAQEHLHSLEQDRHALQADLGDIEQGLQLQHQQRDALSQQRLRRQQQADQCQDLLDRHLQDQRRAVELRDDELPDAALGAPR
ncbi:hypothetical protein [Pseudomonas baltica]|uniref:hypothetical protein n=1 Tax=Pseudomonas baltica TaxID=2762576 RepID=UPI00289F2BE9|nr:hypothetical protein [Pseudomonas baltica]